MTPAARLGAAVVAGGLLAAVAQTATAQTATAQPAAAVRRSCPPRPFRWQEDCRQLAGAELHGLDRLRYVPLSADDEAWLTLGGEARARMDLLHDIDFGIGGQPGYTEFAGRVLVNADLRTPQGPRAFVQLGVVQEVGRKPGPRTQDESGLDVTQAFVDAPWSAGAVRGVLRLGRQEIDLSANRLLSSRDGATLRRTFEGAKLDMRLGGAVVAVVSVHPVDLRVEPFADRADKTERFNALSIDLPVSSPGGGALNLFVFDRQRESARYLRAQGRERRYTLGAHYARQSGPWSLDAQVAAQTGRVQGKPIRAYGFAIAADRELGGPLQTVLNFDLVAASGDRKRTDRIETFDPIYPNNGGLSDAPLLYQTNYVFGGGGVSLRWAGVTWASGANLLARESVGDAVYANGRPIPGQFGGARLTSILGQVSARKAFGTSYEIYGSLVRAVALKGVENAGGRDVVYSRVQLTARF